MEARVLVDMVFFLGFSVSWRDRETNQGRVFGEREKKGKS